MGAICSSPSKTDPVISKQKRADEIAETSSTSTLIFVVSSAPKIDETTANHELGRPEDISEDGVLEEDLSTKENSNEVRLSFDSGQETHFQDEDHLIEDADSALGHHGRTNEWWTPLTLTKPDRINFPKDRSSLPQLPRSSSEQNPSLLLNSDPLQRRARSADNPVSRSPSNTLFPPIASRDPSPRTLAPSSSISRSSSAESVSSSKNVLSLPAISRAGSPTLKKADSNSQATKIEHEEAGAGLKVVGTNDSANTGHPKLLIFEGIAMTIRYKVLVEGIKVEEEKKEIQMIIDDVFGEMNLHFNIYNPKSEISRLNACKANQDVEISVKMESLLELANECVVLTGGLFDPTVYSLVQFWNSSLDKGTIPDEDALSSIEGVGWDNIQFGNGSFSKSHDSTALDFGALAKGYCVDTIVERLNSSGYSDVYVDWGSEIKVSGQHPDGRPWCTGIAQPPSLRELFSVWKSDERSHKPHAEVTNLKIMASVDLFHTHASATSGDYFQPKRFGFCHIINPKTKKALRTSRSSVASVSVISDCSAVADALATAAMCCETVDKAKEFLQNCNINLDRSRMRLKWYLYSRDGKTSDTSEGNFAPTTKIVRMSSFRNVLRSLPRPTCILTLYTEESEAKEHAITVTSMSEMEIYDKNYFVFNLMTKSMLASCIQTNSQFSVHLLGSNQAHIAEMFAKRTPNFKKDYNDLFTRDSNNFVGFRNQESHSVQAKVSAIHEAGDHIIVVGQIVRDVPSVNPQFEPLMHLEGKYLPMKLKSFKKAETHLHSLLQIPKPVALVTVGSDSSRSGIMINSFNSCSLQPPLISFTIDFSSRLHAFFSRLSSKSGVEYISINVLGKSQDTQANWFADPSANMEELFMYVPMNSSYKTPQILGAFGIMYCKVYSVSQALPSSKVLLVLAEVVDVETYPSGDDQVLLHHLKNYCLLANR